MGNTTSEVASGVKAQINSDGQGPELYKYVDFKVYYLFISFCFYFENSIQGGGEFIDVMRVANRTKDYTQIDAMIREIIPKFLYNGGEGKLVENNLFVKEIFFLLKIFFLGHD
jgi:hypothetical protein